VRLHYVERGQGDPVVLIHGNGSLIQDFTVSGLVDELASRYRVIVIDRPGYGYSTRPGRFWSPGDYARVFHGALRQLGVGQAVVLGHSWGTLVAIALALEFPQFVRGLVLASGYYYPTPRADVIVFSPPAMPVAGDLMRHTVSPLIARMILPKLFRRIFEPTAVPERFRRLFPAGLTLRPSQLRASAEDTAMMIPSAMDLEQHYRHLTLPVAIIAGADDRIVDVSRQSRRLHESLPQSTFTAMLGIGHMIHHIVPDVVSGLVDQVRARPETRTSG
jgi:pimeloyl-ACP methyl ester carboxylesterase